MHSASPVAVAPGVRSRPLAKWRHATAGTGSRRDAPHSSRHRLAAPTHPVAPPSPPGLQLGRADVLCAQAPAGALCVALSHAGRGRVSRTQAPRTPGASTRRAILESTKSCARGQRALDPCPCCLVTCGSRRHIKQSLHAVVQHAPPCRIGQQWRARECVQRSSGAESGTGRARCSWTAARDAQCGLRGHWTTEILVCRWRGGRRRAARPE